MCLKDCGSSFLKKWHLRWEKTDRLTKSFDSVCCFFSSSLFFCFPIFPLCHYCLSASFLCHHCFPFSLLHQSAFLSSEYPDISCPNEWRRVWLLLLFSLLLSTVFACLLREERLSLKGEESRWKVAWEDTERCPRPFQPIRPLGTDR